MAGRPPVNEVTNVPPSTRPRPPLEPPAPTAPAWANLGWWTDAPDYPRAAEALAQRVGAAGELSAADVVVDYACGYGDSLRLWVEAFDVRRVVGVEPDARTVRIARARVDAWGLSSRVTVVEGRAEQLGPRALAADVSAVVCVDSAYHFATRATWLSRVAADLPVGGRLAWSDLTLPGAAAQRAGIRASAALMGIPRANLTTTEALRAVAQESGLQRVELGSCGEAVLDGFARATMPRGVQPAVTRVLLRGARRRGLVDYVIATGRR